MRVQNMTSSKGNKIANEFIIETGLNIKINNRLYREAVYFQSYNVIIVCEAIDNETGNKQTFLDSIYWDYSVTTGRYRNKFLGERKAETQKKINSGEYILTNLN